MFAKNYQAKSTFSISWPKCLLCWTLALQLSLFVYVAYKHSWCGLMVCVITCFSMQERSSHANTLFLLYNALKVGVRTTNITWSQSLGIFYLDTQWAIFNWIHGSKLKTTLKKTDFLQICQGAKIHQKSIKGGENCFHFRELICKLLSGFKTENEGCFFTCRRRVHTDCCGLVPPRWCIAAVGKVLKSSTSQIRAYANTKCWVLMILSLPKSIKA